MTCCGPWGKRRTRSHAASFSDLLFRSFGHVEVVEALPAEEIARAVELGLAEDIGAGDVTTLATVPADLQASAVMAAREPLVLAGMGLAEACFRQVSASVRIVRKAEDGQQLGSGATLLTVTGGFCWLQNSEWNKDAALLC